MQYPLQHSISFLQPRHALPLLEEALVGGTISLGSSTEFKTCAGPPSVALFSLNYVAFEIFVLACIDVDVQELMSQECIAPLALFLQDFFVKSLFTPLTLALHPPNPTANLPWATTLKCFLCPKQIVDHL